MNKSLPIFAGIAAILLTACGTTPPPPSSTTTKCKVNSKGDIECEVVVVWTNQSNKYNNLELLAAEDVNIDFSASSTHFVNDPFNQYSSLGTISLKNEGVVFASQATSYTKTGQKIIASDGQVISDWMGGYNGQADEIVLTINKVGFELENGNNTVVSEVRHNNAVLGGSSDSYYHNGETTATYGGSN